MLFVSLTRSTTRGKNYGHFRGILFGISYQAQQNPINPAIIEFQTNLKQLGKIYCGCDICRKEILFILCFPR